GVAVDGAGDVYIADDNNNRVVEVTAAGVASVLNIGSPGGTASIGPTTVALDGAGDVYIADYNNSRVVEVTPAGASSVLNVGTPGGEELNNLYGVAVDGAGDVYIGDKGNSRVVDLSQAQAVPLTFASTNVGSTSSDSPQDVTVQNIGNQPLNITALSTVTTGQTNSSFNLNGSGTSCSTSIQLTAGESCELGVEFAPLAAGTLAGTVNITDNNLNAAAPNYAVQQISLSGTGLARVVTQLSFGIGSAPPTTITAGGNAGTVVVDEELSNGGIATTASDSITLTVTGPNSYSQSYTATAVNGVATFSLSGVALTVAGSYTYTASLSGVPGATATETVTALTTGDSLTVSYPTTAFVGMAETGTVEAVDQYNNVDASFSGAVNITTTDSLATVTTPVTLTNGVGSFTVTFATAGTQTITASATGIANGSETGIVVSAVPSFVVTVATDTTAGVAANCPGSNCSLRDALAAAAAAGGGNITFDPTVFASAPPIKLGSAGTLVVPVNTTITGPTTGSGATLANLVTVDGANTYTVFNIAPSLPIAYAVPLASPSNVSDSSYFASITNLNIQNGNGGADGTGGPGTPGGAGGINNYGTLTVTHCVFTNNTGTDAGALYNWDGALTVTNSTFTGNSSLGGGSGPANGNGWYGDAGAIFNDDENPFGSPGPAAVRANGIHPFATPGNLQRRYHPRGQRAGSQGAAQSSAKASATPMGTASSPANGTLTVTNSTFTGNRGTYTGGIYNYATATVTNSTFGGTAAGAGNTSKGDGTGDPDAGALNNGTDSIPSSATVTNSTFTNNSGAFAGAIINADDDSIGALLQAQNSTFTGNTSSGDGSGDPDAGAIAITWGESGSSVNSSAVIAYSTFYQNSSSSQSGGGAIANSYDAATAVLAGTITGNSGYYGAVYGEVYSGIDTAAIGNSIVSGNTTTDPKASTDGTTPDLNGFTNQVGNVVGSSGTNLAPLGNYGGSNPTQTMIPLPASTAICAGSSSELQAFNTSSGLNLTTDQRGLPNTNSSYPGYSSTACVDAGSVQTNYAITYNPPMPSTAVMGVTITPAPVVQLTESSLPANFATSSITLTDSATPTALGGTTTEAFLNGSATFNNLDFTAAVTGDTLTATLPLNTSLTTPLNLTLTSTVSATSVAPSGTDFTITATTPAATVQPGSLAVFTFTVSPTGGATAFAAAVNLTVTGLPPGATAKLAPDTIAAGAGATMVTLTIQTAQGGAAVAQLSPGAGGAHGSLLSRLAPFSLALLLLPFAGRLRKTGKRFGRMISLLLLLIAGAAAVAGVSGCGSSVGFFGQTPKSYTVTVTATSGTLSHSANVTLTVE
ncbi:MAG: hypothetical protein ACP5FH_06395, partial [Terracidiphilus sp.]